MVRSVAVVGTQEKGNVVSIGWIHRDMKVFYVDLDTGH